MSSLLCQADLAKPTLILGKPFPLHFLISAFSSCPSVVVPNVGPAVCCVEACLTASLDVEAMHVLGTACLIPPTVLSVFMVDIEGTSALLEIRDRLPGYYI